MSNNSLLIKNANIVDGTGTDAFVGDVLVENGVIKILVILMVNLKLLLTLMD